MNTPIVLTVIADDHPGIINTVSEVLYKYGGAWTESSMASLAGQFAGILLASVPSDKADACVEALQGLGTGLARRRPRQPNQQAATGGNT